MDLAARFSDNVAAGHFLRILSRIGRVRTIEKKTKEGLL
jgi:hypothetical protein